MRPADTPGTRDAARDDLANPLLRKPVALPLLAALFIGLSTIVDPLVREQAVREVIATKLVTTAALVLVTGGMLLAQRRNPEGYFTYFAVVIKFVLACGICSMIAIGGESPSLALTYVMIILITPTYVFSSARMAMADILSPTLPFVALVMLSDAAPGMQVRYLVTLAAGMIVTLITSRYFAGLRRDIESVRQDLLFQARHDPITGLGNRLTWYQQARRVLAEGESRNADAVSMLYIDLDRFKRINDEYGHAVGDRALRAIADSISQHLLPDDIVARIGGEEFVVLLPGQSLGDAALTAEAIQRELADAHDVLTWPLTASIGIAMYRPGEPLDDFVNRADQAMLRAKQAGRNRVVVVEYPTDLVPVAGERQAATPGLADDQVIAVAPSFMTPNP